MKLSYIIMPFKNADYLVRCINSLKRQKDCEYEIILSETRFEDVEKIEKILSKRPEVKHFLAEYDISDTSESDELKVSRALESVTGDYIFLLDVNAIAVPDAGKKILETAKGDLTLVNVFIKDQEKY